MSELEQKFHRTLVQGYEDAKRECGYNATYYIHMIAERGALATARHLITSDKPSDGFTRLWECGKLSFTVEAVALDPTYSSLFTEEELTLARERLQQYGYEVG